MCTCSDPFGPADIARARALMLGYTLLPDDMRLDHPTLPNRHGMVRWPYLGFWRGFRWSGAPWPLWKLWPVWRRLRGRKPLTGPNCGCGCLIGLLLWVRFALGLLVARQKQQKVSGGG